MVSYSCEKQTPSYAEGHLVGEGVEVPCKLKVSVLLSQGTEFFQHPGNLEEDAGAQMSSAALADFLILKYGDTLSLEGPVHQYLDTLISENHKMCNVLF